MVFGRFPPDDGLTALGEASVRFMRVDELGTEHPDDDAAAATYDAGLYTPNDVSTPTIEATGIHMYVDCKGGMEDAMAATFRRILREELEAAGITDARGGGAVD